MKKKYFIGKLTHDLVKALSTAKSSVLCPHNLQASMVNGVWVFLTPCVAH